MYKTDEMIEKIIVAVAGPLPPPQQAYYLRQSLRHLVRLAQLEKAADVKRCVALATGTPVSADIKKRSRATTRKLFNQLRSRQGCLNFESNVM